MDNSHIIVGGSSGIGEILCEIICRETNDHVWVFDQSFHASDVYNQRVTRVSCVVDEHFDWNTHISRISCVKSISFVVPACKTRDPNEKELGFTDQFVKNTGIVNFSLLRLLESVHEKFATPSSVVLVSSVLSTRVALGDATLDYHASKAVLDSITRYMALRLAPNTIVNSIAPGLIARGETSALITDAKYANAVHITVPLQRPSKQLEVANAIWTLASGSLGYVTGQTIIMDGGCSVLDPYSLVQRI
jgi:NAD(P)-dependent dehydrogenase (short-subunit alcohol dehydrogenase family)